MSSIAAGNFSPADDGDQLSRSCSTTAGVPAAVGDPYAINYGAVRNMTHVLFCGEDYRLAYLYYDTKWNYQDLTTAVPRLTSVAFEGKPFAIVYGRLSRLYVYCRDYDHQLWELVFDGGSWQATDLLQEPPTWTGPQVYGDPRAVEFNGILHLFYRDVSNHIWHVYRGVQKWTAEDVTQAVSGPLPQGDPSVVVFQNNVHVLFRDQANDMADFSWNGSQWTYTSVAPTGSMLLTGDPFAIVFSSQLHVLYRSGTGSSHISDNYFSTSWNYQDLNAKAGASPLARAAGDPTAAILKGNELHVVYRDVNDHVSDLWYGQNWSWRDLTALVT